jgi:hypothetical protein
MKFFVASVSVFFCLLGTARAANTLSSDQLMKSADLALKDYALVEPDMSASISGIRSVTVGTNAIVTLEMNADGMKMSAKYICIPKADGMNCNQQP